MSRLIRSVIWTDPGFGDSSSTKTKPTRPGKKYKAIMPKPEFENLFKTNMNRY